MRHLLIITFLLISACAHRSHVAEEYLEKTKKASEVESSAKTNKTVVFFLIDGLSTSVLKRQLNQNNLPGIKNFFLNRNNTISNAHSVFPTLTYTNVSGLLREKPVHLTGSIGNKIFFKNRLIDFEAIGDRKYFTELMHTDNVFERPQKKKYLTVSLDYGLGADATISSGFDFQSGYAASQLDYAYLDQKKIDSLRILLTETDKKNWPDFIFIHLVGLDFLSHRFGPLSDEAMAYLLRLDSQLQNTFQVLKAAESSRQVITMLSADHGFHLKSTNYFNIEDFIQKMDPKLRLLNEARYAGIYYLEPPKESQIQKLAAGLIQNSNVEIVAYKNKSRIHLISKKLQVYFDQQSALNCLQYALGVSINGEPAVCSNNLPMKWKNKFYPFFIENMASYFKAEKAADVIAISPDDVIYSLAGKGFHGGPTPDETIVPVLIRNGRLSLQQEIQPSWQLLQFVGQ